MRPSEVRSYGLSTLRDGVKFTFYGDGSGPSFEIVKLGVTYASCNERLEANYRRSGKVPYRDEACTPSRESLLLNPRATTLRYTRDFGFCYMPYLCICGDAGRMFPPQEWARGVLPIIPVQRVFAFAEGAGREVLEYDPHPSPEILQSAILLLLHGWDATSFLPLRWRTQDFVRLLSAQGFRCTGRQVRAALDALKAQGRAAYRGRGVWGYASWMKTFDSPASSGVQALNAIYAPYETLCKVPLSKLRFDPAWWRPLKFQGFSPPIA